jgi:hypothetical protein
MLAAWAITLAPGCSERFDWREVRSDDGFVALLPGRPQQVTRDIDIAGQRAPMTMWSTGTGPTMFAVGTMRLPPAAFADAAARQATLAYFRDALVRNIGGTQATARVLPPIASAGKPVAESSFEAIGRPGPDGRKSRLAARVLIVDDRLFQLVSLGAEGEIPPETLDTFFTSFRLTP